MIKNIQNSAHINIITTSPAKKTNAGNKNYNKIPAFKSVYNHSNKPHNPLYFAPISFSRKQEIPETEKKFSREEIINHAKGHLEAARILIDNSKGDEHEKTILAAAQVNLFHAMEFSLHALEKDKNVLGPRKHDLVEKYLFMDLSPKSLGGKTFDYFKTSTNEYRARYPDNNKHEEVFSRYNSETLKKRYRITADFVQKVNQKGIPAFTGSEMTETALKKKQEEKLGRGYLRAAEILIKNYQEGKTNPKVISSALVCCQQAAELTLSSKVDNFNGKRKYGHYLTRKAIYVAEITGALDIQDVKKGGKYYALMMDLKRQYKGRYPGHKTYQDTLKVRNLTSAKRIYNQTKNFIEDITGHKAQKLI